MSVTVQYLKEVKELIRISDATIAFDVEITDLIEGAEGDLVLAGVLDSKMDAFIADADADKLIKRAVNTYVKANFGWNNPDKEDFQDSYDNQKRRMTLTQEYTVEVT